MAPSLWKDDKTLLKHFHRFLFITQLYIVNPFRYACQGLTGHDIWVFV